MFQGVPNQAVQDMRNDHLAPIFVMYRSGRTAQPPNDTIGRPYGKDSCILHDSPRSKPKRETEIQPLVDNARRVKEGAYAQSPDTHPVTA